MRIFKIGKYEINIDSYIFIEYSLTMYGEHIIIENKNSNDNKLLEDIFNKIIKEKSIIFIKNGKELFNVSLDVESSITYKILNEEDDDKNIELIEIFV